MTFIHVKTQSRLEIISRCTHEFSTNTTYDVTPLRRSERKDALNVTFALTPLPLLSLPPLLFMPNSLCRCFSKNLHNFNLKLFNSIFINYCAQNFSLINYYDYLSHLILIKSLKNRKLNRKTRNAAALHFIASP